MSHRRYSSVRDAKADHSAAWTAGTTAVSYFNASNLVGVIAVHRPEAATAIWLPWLLTSLFIIAAVFGAWIIIGAARYLWPVLLGAWVLFVAWFLAMFLSAVCVADTRLRRKTDLAFAGPAKSVRRETL